jgi:hypothetical protein
MNRITPILILPLLGALVACGELEAHQPTLAEQDAASDATIDLVDRAAVLAEATENEAGEAPVLSGADASFFMEVDSTDMQGSLAASGSKGPPPPAATFLNAQAAQSGVAWADQVVVTLVGPPAAAIAFAGSGTLTQHEPWLWSATNSVTGPDGASATANLNVAWVGVGWLAEMRLTTSDGSFDDTLWFNGFLHHTGGFGWWDFYSGDQVVAVLEWLGDEQGNWEAGIGSLAGETSGDILAYWGTAAGERGVNYWDNDPGFMAYALLNPDLSGETQLSNHNGGAVSCWDSSLADVACQ